jgi:hypothetical protein
VHGAFTVGWRDIRPNTVGLGVNKPYVSFAWVGIAIMPVMLGLVSTAIRWDM